ncbi:cytochrome c oxidase subunit 3 [Alsobacter sp. SYSU M60028]|uniref:Cytochrome c oxidase subunit 3 n=1 Tax=Alsobacter ponti TaxID=2962936 RepID=A0ABT1L7K6_9HYPH|nr:cytochrome c oxidase subunit 3 [Alsobacter ponti]MCP8937444.1 cytochrome c oxidase subunit 3 [Alsobacter ponti]
MSDTVHLQAPLPTGSVGKLANGWFGMIALVATEGALFAYLLFSYFYFDVQYGRSWLPDPLPAFRLSGPNTAILVVSSLTMVWAERAARRGANGRAALGIALSFVLGLVFVGIQLMEWKDKTFNYASSSYGSLYFLITGFHMAHVVAGLLVLAALLAWTLLGYFDARRHAPVSIGALYWHFVDVVWLCVFFSLYVTPHLR